MSKPVLNIDDLTYEEFGHGERFRAQRAPVSAGIGAKKLGCGVIRLAPGKRAWPYHAHHVIEEMFFILKGEGTLRHAGEEHAVRAGDFVCAPADPNQPHQLINTSDAELSYIAISTMENADVVLYPDSGKYGVWHGTTRDPKAPDTFRVIARMKDAVDYWDGE
jgi:uncharacterized cupin superfamily protein